MIIIHIPTVYHLLDLVRWEQELKGVRQEFNSKSQQTKMLIENVEGLLNSIDSMKYEEFHRHVAKDFAAFQQKYENFKEGLETNERTLSGLLKANQVNLEIIQNLSKIPTCLTLTYLHRLTQICSLT